MPDSVVPTRSQRVGTTNIPVSTTLIGSIGQQGYLSVDVQYTFKEDVQCTFRGCEMFNVHLSISYL